MARTWKLFCTTSHHCQGRGRESIPGKRGSFLPSKCVGRRSWVTLNLTIPMRITCLFLVHLKKINTVAVPVNFLISLLFPVSCSYLHLQSLPIAPPILNCILLQGEG